MDKQELEKRYLNFLSENNLAPERCLLASGGALMMLGLREQSSDLDLDVPREVYDQLLEAGYEETQIDSPCASHLIKYDDFIDVHAMPATVHGMVTNGIGHYTPIEVMAQKRLLRDWDQRSPEKSKADQRDIDNITRMLLK